jgi:hypothetical protein
MYLKKTGTGTSFPLTPSHIQVLCGLIKPLGKFLVHHWPSVDVTTVFLSP